MGYTHYFPHTMVSQKVWNQIVEDCKKLYANMPKYSESSGGFYNMYPIALDGCVRERNKGKNKPVFSSTEIWFNGTDLEEKRDLGHETFSLHINGSKGFAFCKTARKPYDLMVQACLLVYKHHSPNTIKLGSDGDDDDWQVAVKFVQDVLGYEETPFAKVEESA